MGNPYVTPDLFDFFQDLRENNDRDWFAENKHRYIEHVKDPLLQFIEDFAPLLSSISPHFRAIPRANGGSLFRIYRDIRFSKNKDPYKTHAGVHFRHELGKSAHAPGFYLHLQPDSVFVALGVWQPERDALYRIRTAIGENPESWNSLIKESDFSSNFTLAGDALKRAPKGFDPDHPEIEDLKRKDFFGVCGLTEEVVLAPDLLPHLAEIWDSGREFMRFISNAIGVAF